MKAKTNVLIALRNILKHNSTRLTPLFKSNGSANAVGDNLEYFIKDMFCCDALQYSYVDQKEVEYKKLLSWTGDSSHFPDLIVQGGVGVESKKVNDTSYGTIPLNSSYPKDYVTKNSQNYPKKSLIYETNADWVRKPIIYAIGNLNTKNVKKEFQLISLWFAYGNTMVPNNKYYQDIISGIRSSIKEANSDIKLKKSKELARVQGIDKLGNTNMRVRGMYELEHPARIFNRYIKDIALPKDKSKIYVVMLDSELQNIITDMDEKWNSLANDLNYYKANKKLFERKIKIPDPNNIKDTLPATIFIACTD